MADLKKELTQSKPVVVKRGQKPKRDPLLQARLERVKKQVKKMSEDNNARPNQSALADAEKQEESGDADGKEKSDEKILRKTTR